ncbi:MAG: phosphatase PAP2 family protein [Alphaproteobacteria bacterium]|nr:phosphatase PAP2 family protein [Alphaproteobacteria bacterium]
MIFRLRAHQTWPLAFLIAAAVVSFVWLDLPLARWTAGNIGRMNALGTGLASPILLSIEAATALTLIVVRLARGHLSRWNEAVALASLTSICAYAVNENVLKLIFGVPNPQSVLMGASHALHLMAGGPTSSFPSGHMVLASAFAGVLMNLQPRIAWPLWALLAFGILLLVWGDWHFASDAFAGTFAGLAAGFLAGEVWQAHAD